MIKANEAILFFWMLFLGIAVFMLGVIAIDQSRKINELEILQQEKKIIDGVKTQSLVFRM
jgi:hypothetical protein